MFDPKTRLFVIRIPGWRTRQGQTSLYWKPLAVVYHRDPMRDGTDDSCGFIWPKPSWDQKEAIRFLVKQEVNSPWFVMRANDPIIAPHVALIKLQGAFHVLAEMFHFKLREETKQRLAAELLHTPEDNVREALFAYRADAPGALDENEQRRDAARALFNSVAKLLLREVRPWYRHPRWHFHHWTVRLIREDAAK